MRIKRIIAIGALVFAGTVALAPASQASTSSTTRRLAFRVLMHQYGIPLSEATPIAKGFCAIADATSFHEAFLAHYKIAREQGMDVTTMGRIVGAGVVAYCPRYRDDINSLA